MNTEPFPAGQYLVELAATGRPGLVLSAIAGTMGVSDVGAGDDALTQALKRALQQRILLVLDNFEHVLTAAPLVAELLSEAPTLKVIATSRAPLRLSGEREFRIAPFPVPDEESDGGVEGAIDNPAVQLFLERAYSDEKGDPGVTELLSIASICRRVDGICSRSSSLLREPGSSHLPSCYLSST
jgi:predicted ATPase